MVGAEEAHFWSHPAGTVVPEGTPCDCGKVKKQKPARPTGDQG
jgi:hypothetical protein